MTKEAGAISEPWHEPALALRAAGGMKQAAIGRAVGVSRSSVNKFFSAYDFRAAHGAPLPVGDAEFVNEHKPRTIRKIVNRRAYASAFRAWLDGLITRSEMIESISA